MSGCVVLFQLTVFMSVNVLSWGGGWRPYSTANNTTDYCIISGLHTLHCTLSCPNGYFQSDKSCDRLLDREEDDRAPTQVPLATTTESTSSNVSKLLKCCESVLVSCEDHGSAAWLAGGLLGGVVIGIAIALAAVVIYRRNYLKREETKDVICDSHHRVPSVYPVLPTKMIDPRPVFSPDWQMSKEVTSQGATIKAKCSDVYLSVPDGAVESSDTVVIEAAISTDIEEVHRKFEDIPVEEYVASPLAEYTTRNNYRFQKSVMVTLPHFLPPSFSKDCVRVYQFNRGLYERLELTQLKHLQVDDPKRDPNVTCSLQKDATGVFFFDENDQIHILTNHFTGFFCTDCKRDYPIQQIYLDVHGKLETSDDGAVIVDIRLEAFDRRICIKDFETNRPDRLAANYDNMRRLDLKVLPSPPENTDPKLVLLGSRLELMSTDDEQVWMHSQCKGGEQLFPTENTIDLTRLVPCKCRNLPERIDWQLASCKGVRPRSDFRCFIDAGYVTTSPEDLSTFEFLRNPKYVRFNVRLECVAPTLVRSRSASSSAAIAEVDDNRRASSSETRHTPPDRTSGIPSMTYRWPYRNSSAETASETRRKGVVTCSDRASSNRQLSPDFLGEEGDSVSGECRRSVSREDSGLSSSSNSTTIVIESLKGSVNLSMNGAEATGETRTATNTPATREFQTDDTETLRDDIAFSTPVQVSDDE